MVVKKTTKAPAKKPPVKKKVAAKKPATKYPKMEAPRRTLQQGLQVHEDTPKRRMNLNPTTERALRDYRKEPTPERLWYTDYDSAKGDLFPNSLSPWRRK